MSSYLNWHVGMKVVCVDASRWEKALTKGGVYTISAIGEEFGDVWIGCEETAELTPNSDLQWEAYRFRALVTRKTDISCFEAILHGARVGEDA